MSLRIRAVVAAPARNALICGEGLGATIDIKGFTYLDHRQGRTTACGAMTSVAGGLRRALVAAYPGLAKIVHAMGATGGAVRHSRMADCALADRRGIPLGINGRPVVVHLVAVGARFICELGMGRVVAGLALQVTVAFAVTEQGPTFCGCIRI